MNKILIILASLLLLGFPCFADNVLSLSEASGHPSDTVEISLSLENTDDVVAIQLDIPLGSSLTYETGSCVHVGRTNGHELTASVVNGTLKIITYSLSLSPYTGNSGEVLKFKLKLGNQPGTIVLEPSLAVVSAANGNSLETIVNNGRVTLLTPEIQINTPTIDFGHIPIRSVYNRSISITNSGNEPLSISEITFSNDRFSSDFNGTTIPAGGNGSITLNYAPVDEGAVNEYVTIVSNSISGNQTISLVADPFAVNELHVVQASGYSDSTIMVALTMNNMSEISGMQCKFKMPSALEYVEGSFALNPNRSNGHQVWSGMSNDTLTFVAFSLSNAIFSGNDDTIATFLVTLVGTYGNYRLTPLDPILSNVEGVNKLSASYYANVTIRSPRISCANTLDMGSSSVTETVVKQFSVRNNGNAPLRIDNVMFDQLGFSIQNELPLVVEQYQTVNLEVAYSREMEGSYSANMQIQSNDPSYGVYNVTVSGSRFEPNCMTIVADAYECYENVTLSFDMDNYTDITAVQFDFAYPHEQYVVNQSDIVAGNRVDGHSLTSYALNDSVYRIMLFSMQNDVFGGHSGSLVSVTMHPVDSLATGTYSASASGVVLSDVAGVNKFSCDDPTVFFTTVCPVDSSTVTHVMCEGDLYDFGGRQLSETGMYVDTLQNIHGCDSIITLNLTVNPVSSSIFEHTACDSYEWVDGITYTESTSEPTFTFTNVYGCDSVVTLHLTINHSNTGIDTQSACDSFLWIDGNTYTESTNSPAFTLTNAVGCDSVVTLHLTINHSNTGIDEQVACDSYEWIDGITYTESTSTPTFTLRNAEGCDSVVTLHLTINHSNTGIDEQVACDTYEWIDGVTYTESTSTPTFTLRNAEGCDSVVTLHLTINHSNTGIDEQIACDSFEWIDGVTYTESTSIPTFTLRNAEGCDSVVTLHLTINHPLAELVEVTTCDSYEWNAETYTESGNYTQTFTASNGCDSVVTLHLTINHSNTGIDEQVACDSYEWIDGVTYTESTSTPTFTLRNAEGCDSVVTLHLTINHSNTGIDEQVACDSYEWIDGVTYTESTSTPTFTLRNAEGCDSVVTLHLTINHSNTGIDEQVACDSFEWIDGVTYTESTITPTFTLRNAEGCDSVVTLHLTINHSNTGIDEQVACDSFEWIDGVTYTESTSTPTFTLRNAEGCDSVVTLHLTINHSNTGIDEQIACDSFEWIDGVTYTESTSIPTFTLRNAEGCDSVVTLHLTINHSNTGIDEQVACDSYEWIDGVTYTESTDSPTYTLTNAEGCDSVVTLHLTINHSAVNEITETACESYEWNAQTYASSGDYVQTFQTVNGCDSVVTLHLTINNSVHSEFSISTWEPYSWNGIEYAETGDYIQTLGATNGCDSIVTLHLTLENSLQMSAESSMFYEDVLVSFDVNNIDDVTAVQFDFIYPHNAYSIETSDFVLTDRANGHSISVSQLNDSTCRVVVFSMQNSLIVGHSGTLVIATLHPYATAVAGTYHVYAENVSLVNVQGANVNTGTNPQISFTTICPSHETYMEQSICEGESFEFFGQTLDTAGVYTETLQTVLGCDSIITLTLNVLPLPVHELSVSACEEYVWNDSVYYESGNYVQTFATSTCDSIVTLHLTINHSSASEIYDTTNALSYVWNDSTYSVSGDYIQTFTLANGCDSVVTLHLYFIQVGLATWREIETSVYPNPASADLFVVSDELISYVELFSVAGELIFQNEVYGNKAVCNVEGLVPGLYFVRVHYAGTGYSASYKFVKE